MFGFGVHLVRTLIILRLPCWLRLLPQDPDASFGRTSVSWFGFRGAKSAPVFGLDAALVRIPGYGADFAFGPRLAAGSELRR